MVNTNRWQWHHGGRQVQEAAARWNASLVEILAPLKERLSPEDYATWCRGAINRPNITAEEYRKMVDKSLDLLDAGAGICEVLEEIGALEAGI